HSSTGHTSWVTFKYHRLLPAIWAERVFTVGCAEFRHQYLTSVLRISPHEHKAGTNHQQQQCCHSQLWTHRVLSHDANHPASAFPERERLLRMGFLRHDVFEQAGGRL